MKLLRKIFFPFVPFYYMVTWTRNKLYDFGIKKSISFNFPVICVGNLSVGGTGKTPMIEYLIHLLKDDYAVATLSRGYMRKTKGFQLANANHSAESLGDEPFQFYNKFKNRILVAVDSDRVHGIQQLRSLDNPPQVVLLDDAFQHRKVKAGFNILLTAYNNLYTNDLVLPTGNLREPNQGAKRANVIIITKCPDTLGLVEQNAIIKEIDPRSNQHVFFSSIDYSNEVFSMEGRMKVDELKDFTLVTGIANAHPLIGFLRKKNLEFEHLNFKDHHEFSKQEIMEFQKKTMIVTTEKDFMRLKQYESLNGILFFLPIQISISDPLKFNNLINDFVKG